MALARVKADGNWRPAAEPLIKEEWLVAKVCSAFIQNCEHRAKSHAISLEYRDEVVRYLNRFSEYCGALPVSQLKKGHVEFWVESQGTWTSPVTCRNAIAIVLATFNHSQNEYEVRNPIKRGKKPPFCPRLHSFNAEDEALIYGVTDEPFAIFLFTAVHTGLRPYCELARLTARDIEETPRGTMW